MQAERELHGTHAHKHHPLGRVSWVVLGLIGVWFLLMRQFGGADMYSVLGPYAAAVVLVLWLLRSRALRRWLRPTWVACALGLGVGVLMTLATYPIYDLAARLVPGLDAYVKAHYGSARTGSLWLELGWVSLIILAEELLFRGVLLEVLERHLSRPLAGALGVVLYTVAQLGSGSWVIGAMALVCGGVWTLQRYATNSLVAPLISHMIWTPSVILLHPVT